MLFFVNVRIDPKNLSFEEMWDVWEKETEAAIGAKGVGKIVNLWKVAGQRRIIAIVNVESHDVVGPDLHGRPTNGPLPRVRGDFRRPRIRKVRRGCKEALEVVIPQPV